MHTEPSLIHTSIRRSKPPMELHYIQQTKTANYSIRKAKRFGYLFRRNESTSHY